MDRPEQAAKARVLAASALYGVSRLAYPREGLLRRHRRALVRVAAVVWAGLLLVQGAQAAAAAAGVAGAAPGASAIVALRVVATSSVRRDVQNIRDALSLPGTAAETYLNRDAHYVATLATTLRKPSAFVTSAVFVQHKGAGHVHVHGGVKLAIAIEGRGFTIDLDTPLDNLIGIERAPRNDAERKRVADALALLKAASRLFAADAAAGCTAAASDLHSAALGLGAPASVSASAPSKPSEPSAPSSPSAAIGTVPARPLPLPPPTTAEAHADLEGGFTFTCTSPDKLTTINTTLFDAFPGIRRIDVQIAGPKGQSARTLKRPERRIVLAR